MLSNAAHDCTSVASNIGNMSDVWQGMRNISEGIKSWVRVKSKHCVAARLLSFEFSKVH